MHNHSHWANQARSFDANGVEDKEAIARQQEDLVLDWAPQDREPTDEETERDNFLRQLVPSEPARRMCFMVKPGFPLYSGDTITRGKTTLIVQDGVPPDAVLVQVFSDPLNYGLCLRAIFEHPSFPSVPEGAHVPDKAVTYSIAVDRG